MIPAIFRGAGVDWTFDIAFRALVSVDVAEIWRVARTTYPSAGAPS